MLQILLFIGIEITKLECVGHYQKRVGTRLRNLKKKKKKDQVGGVILQTPQLIDYRIMKVQLAILQNAGNLQAMKSIFQFHCFMLFQMRTVYTTIHIVPMVQIVGANTMLVEPTYKPGPGLPKDIIYKIRPIYVFRAK